MTVAVIIIFLSIWVLYSGWYFYKQVKWNDAPAWTPDFAELHKKEAELMHIQEVLEEAHASGKLSDPCMKECQRFFEQELEAIRAAAEPPQKVIQ